MCVQENCRLLVSIFLTTPYVQRVEVNPQPCSDACKAFYGTTGSSGTVTVGALAMAQGHVTSPAEFPSRPVFRSESST